MSVAGLTIETPKAACVEVNVLGPPQVISAGHSLSVPRRSVRGLLYYLASQSTPTSRDQLCLLFWPDIPQAEARRNLTRALTHLRRALPVPDALRCDDDSVSLDPQQTWCDAQVFKRDAGSMQRFDLLEQCILLYRDAFLAGFYLPDCPEFEAWATQERSGYENMYLEALLALIEAKTRTQDYPAAMRYARSYLAVNPLSEDVHRQLIALYFWVGDRSRALRQYEDCLAVLENELGTRPLPETTAIYQAVLEGNLPRNHAQPAQVTYPSNMKSLRLDIPLVGRDSILHQLDSIWQTVQSDQGRLVILSGEAGIGKTRLLYSFAKYISLHGQVLFGSGQPGERSVPYHPIVEALRSVSDSGSLDLAPIWLAEVSRLLPELHEAYPNLPLPFNLRGEEARIRLFDALCHYLSALHAQRGPILLCLDDLHWFDQTSLSWLEHLSHQFASHNCRVMILATYRCEDAHLVHDLLDHLARMGTLEEICLDGLAQVDISALIEVFLGSSLRYESLAYRLQEATGGNPFFILETLQSLAESGLLRAGESGLVDLPLPESVREVITRRIGRLNPRSIQVLEAGSVFGSSFSFTALQRTAGRSDLETSLSLDTLVSRRLLSESGGTYRFEHDLIRRVTHANLSPVRKRILHARAGKALEKIAPEDVTALAYHFDLGGDWRKAVHYYQLSAQKDEALFAWQEAETHRARLLELLAESPSASADKAHWVMVAQEQVNMVQLHYRLGRLVERDADLQRLEEVAELSHEPEAVLLSAIQHAQQLNNDSRYQEAITAAQAGLPLAQKPEFSGERARLLAHIGLGSLQMGWLDQSIQCLKDARACMAEKEDLELQAQIASIAGQVYRVIGDYPNALENYLAAYASHKKLGDPYGDARYVEVSFIYTNLCQFQNALEFLESSLNLARKAAVPMYEGHTLLSWGGWHLHMGDPVAAIGMYQRALDILESLRARHLVASIQTYLAFACYQLADNHQARIYLGQGLNLAQSIGHRIRAALVHILTAALELNANQLSTARKELEEGLEIARQLQSRELISAGLNVSAHLDRLSGYPHQALEHAQEALAWAKEFQLHSYELWARMEAGLALAEMGEIEAALNETQAALALIPQAHQLWLRTEQVHLAHARVLRLAGQDDLAAEHILIAQRIAQSYADRIPSPSQRASFLSAFTQMAVSLA
jgi:DNA-binding SARP family transcriptional activator